MRIGAFILAMAGLVAGCGSTAHHGQDENTVIKTHCTAFILACNEKRYLDARAALASLNPAVPRNYVDGRLERYSQLSFNDPAKMKAVKVIGEKAVLVYLESPTDADPIYFAREGGTWKLLLPLTKYRHWAHSWTAADLRDFDALAAWFKAHKAANVKLK